MLPLSVPSDVWISHWAGTHDSSHSLIGSIYVRIFTVIYSAPWNGPTQSCMPSSLHFVVLLVRKTKSHTLVSTYYRFTNSFQSCLLLSHGSPPRIQKLFIILLYLVMESEMWESCLICIYVSSWISIGDHRSSRVTSVLFKSAPVVIQDWNCAVLLRLL